MRIIKTILIIALSISTYQTTILYGQTTATHSRDSLALIDFYNNMDGPNWTYPNLGGSNKWLQGRVATWYGVSVSKYGSASEPYRVWYLSLGDNNLSGTIPPSIGDLINLEELFLPQNQITGDIPREIKKLTQLREFSLYDNQVTNIPDSIGMLSNLKYLYLAKNQINDTIPKSISGLTNLETLDISENQLYGSIPAEIGNMSKLKILNLYLNQIAGELPSSIVKLKNLQHLRVPYNSLSGVPDLSVLSPSSGGALQILWINNNKLTFEDVVPNMNIAANYVYAPQSNFGQDKPFIIEYGKSLTLTLSLHSNYSGTEFQWVKNGVDIPGANDLEYTIDNVSQADSGDQYTAHMKHNEAPILILNSGVTTLHTRRSLYEGEWRTGEEFVIITNITDDVWVSRNGGEFEIAKVGETLSWGDEIHTGLESKVEIMMPQQSKVSINELTVMRVGTLLRQRDALQTRLMLKIGELEAQVKPKKTVFSDFTVRTPVATASHRGTSFGVIHDSTNGTTTVSVASGHVQVSNIGYNGSNNGSLQKISADSVVITDWQQIEVNEEGLGIIEDITLTQIDISVDKQEFLTGEIMWFSCRGTDTKGLKMNVNAQWSSNGGDVDTIGIFTAGDKAGQFTITAYEPVFDLTATMSITVTDSPVGIGGKKDLPKKFDLDQNYPNPFNPNTIINYSIPILSHVTLKVFDVLGSEVTTIVNKEQPQGNYEVDFDGRELTSGIYFYRLQAGDFIKTKKLMLLK